MTIQVVAKKIIWYFIKNIKTNQKEKQVILFILMMFEIKDLPRIKLALHCFIFSFIMF